MRRRPRAVCLAVLLRALPVALAVSLAPRVAVAEVEAYKQHMDNGVKLFADHNYPAAIAEFQAAYQVKPKASPLMNTALCYKAQFKYHKAIETLELALSKHRDTMDPGDEKIAQDAIVEMKALLAWVKVNVTPPQAAVTVDGEPQVPDAEKKVALAPGAHRIGAKLDGYAATEQEISVVSGDQKELTLALAPTSATAPGDKDKPKPKKGPTRYSTSLMITGIVSGAIGVASGLTGVLLFAAADSKQFCSDNPTNEICTDPGKAKAGGVALMIVGVIGLGAGIPMFLIGNGPPEKPKTAPPAKAAVPMVLLGPTSAAMRWSF